eukprot:5077626-Prymnesium_polylepis.1
MRRGHVPVPQVARRAEEEEERAVGGHRGGQGRAVPAGRGLPTARHRAAQAAADPVAATHAVASAGRGRCRRRVTGDGDVRRGM